MGKLALFILVVFACSMYCVAADVPKAEIFGGYSLFHANSGISDIGGMNVHGWNAEVTGNLNRYLGITGDITGEYKSETVAGASAKVHVYNFMFGPTLSFRAPKAKPFAHVLFGVSRFTGAAEVPIIGGTVDVSDNAFAMAFGGGLDVSMGKIFAVRLGQLDFVRTQFSSTGQNNFRFATGLVLKF